MSNFNSSTGIHSLPGDVIEYASRHGLLPHLYHAIELAEQCFGWRSKVDVAVEADHETLEKRLMVNVQVDGTVAEVLRHYEEFSRQWVATAPPEVVHQIGLLYAFQSPR